MAKTLPVATPQQTASIQQDKERERKWRAEDALRVCEQYEKNKGGKQLMKDVKQLAKQKMNDLKKVMK